MCVVVVLSSSAMLRVAGVRFEYESFSDAVHGQNDGSCTLHSAQTAYMKCMINNKHIKYVMHSVDLGRTFGFLESHTEEASKNQSSDDDICHICSYLPHLLPRRH